MPQIHGGFYVRQQTIWGFLTPLATGECSSLQTDSEKDIRARVEKALGLEDGGIKRQAALKELFKDVVGLHLGIKTDVDPLLMAYQVLSSSSARLFMSACRCSL